eukprot:scaffold213365_cov45-Attheya_sp.AAC.2
MEAMSRNISKLIAQTSKVSFEDADDEMSESEMETDKKKNNRNNSALTRQKRGGKQCGDDRQGRTETDSHANTCVVGKECLVFHDFERPVNVSGFDTSLGGVNDKAVVSAALARFTYPPWIITFCAQCNYVRIDECPKFLHPNPTDTTHAIKFPGVGGKDDYVVPLALHRVTSYFPTRKPTDQEWVNCRQFEITAEGPEWDPHDSQFGEQENALLDDSGQLRDFGDRLRRNRRFLSSIDSQNSRLRARMISETTSQCQAVLNSIDSTLNDARFNKELKSNVRVRMPKDLVAIFVASSERGKQVNAADLVKRRDIGLKTAEKTVEVTMQRGIKALDNPMLNRRFRTDNRNLRYLRLGVDMYTDTLFAGTKSKRGNDIQHKYLVRVLDGREHMA